jgi:hypothetical protein
VSNFVITIPDPDIDLTSPVQLGKVIARMCNLMSDGFFWSLLSQRATEMHADLQGSGLSPDEINIFCDEFVRAAGVEWARTRHSRTDRGGQA